MNTEDFKSDTGPAGRFELEVFYDGLCRLCSREIEFYRKLERAERIRWVDIADPRFDPLKEGLDPEKMHRVFHVRTPQAQWVTGVDGFVEIWKVLPKLKHWVSAASLPGARPLMRVGYAVFARVRPYLPRKKALCADDRCFRETA
jgi:predicted DCC family thiol-disulfide oxidoreductase YuxK